jgi:hypothetical protein
MNKKNILIIIILLIIICVLYYYKTINTYSKSIINNVKLTLNDVTSSFIDSTFNDITSSLNDVTSSFIDSTFNDITSSLNDVIQQITPDTVQQTIKLTNSLPIFDCLVYDFNANNIVITSSSIKISNWTDNYAGIIASQINVAQQPIIISKYINNFPAIYFNNKLFNILIINNSNLTTTELTLFYVMKIVKKDGISQFTTTIGEWGPNSLHLLFNNNKLQINLYPFTDTDWLTDLTPEINKPFILVIILSSINNKITYRYNGIRNEELFTVSNIQINTNFEIGGWTLDSTRQDSFIGGIGEFIYYNGLLNLFDIQYIEGILATNWGLRNTLSPSHLYYLSD